MEEYQAAYRLLFDLIMDGKAFSDEADALRARMDRLPGTKEQKAHWSFTVGMTLYQDRINR